MIHEQLYTKIKQEKANGHFVFPYYGKFSISELAPTLLRRFGVNTNREGFPENFLKRKQSESEKVVLFMVDGFGYDHFLEHYKNIEFYNLLAERGEVFPITSVFPSTTSAALTCIHTGLTPQEHGLPEWTVFFEEVDKIIQTIPFTYDPSHSRDSVLEIGGAPEMLYEGDTIYERLRLEGTMVYSFMPYDLTEGAYTRMTKKGAVLVGYVNGTDLVNKLKEKLETERGPGYYFVYWTQIDSVQHHFGPNSPEHIQQMKDFSYLATKFINETDTEKTGEVLVMMVSDHGQRDISGDKIIYLNDYLPLQENYRKSQKGTMILPSGSPHDVFLFVDPAKLEETKTRLQEHLRGKADVILIEEAIRKGIFGLNDPSVKFLRRIGNLLVLPYDGCHVWYKHSPEDVYHLKGMHGGASEKEMFVPLANARLEDLKAGAMV
ncbi:MAG: alkaline phosphatase family protein [Candidatus Doudnabacteria bacterium]|nr:alkaline phosphatase family protein [Candidatus Doudnabacteria bacterium]